MEMLLGTLIWGGLLLLVLRWVGGRAEPPASPTDAGADTWTSRSSTSARPAAASPPAPPRSPAPARPPATAPRSEEERRRETEALVDGLVIGHYLTRDHERRRAAERYEQLERERSDAAVWPIGDEVTDPSERSEALGLGVEGFGDGSGDGFDEAFEDGSDELDAFDDPQGSAFDAWGEDEEFDDDEW